MQDYGITTGFGEFKNIPLDPAALDALSHHLLLSHCVGVGDTPEADDLGNYFAADVVRATILIRLNAFLKGHSGVRRELLEFLVQLLHQGIVPLVPTRGSLGSSGDLCPLAHLFAITLGHGRYYQVECAQDLLPQARRLRPAAALSQDLGVELLTPTAKEGLALINGATVSAALLALAVHDAAHLAEIADLAAALSLEAICGCARALDPRVHQARGQVGQIASAANLRRLVAGSRLLERAGAVQDPYSLRCAPVVHGASRDAIVQAGQIVEREINAATDNPLFFPADDPEEAPWDRQFAANWPPGYRGEERASYSAGNFHGQPLALAADFLAIAVAELGNISERRTQLLLDRHHNRNLPANLTANRGLNSGYMMVQYCAASLVSENKVLAHPASVDSIPTAANHEDHVAMSTVAGRKLGTVVGNVQAILAAELLVAAQAIDWRVGFDLPPLEGGERALGSPPAKRPASGSQEAAAAEAQAFALAVAPPEQQRIADHLGHGTRTAYLALRQKVPPLLHDRVLADELNAVRSMIRDRELAASVPDPTLAPSAG